jgi:hypothetical protein
MKRQWGWWWASLTVGAIAFTVMPQGPFWREIAAYVLSGIAYDLYLRSGAKSMFHFDD